MPNQVGMGADIYIPALGKLKQMIFHTYLRPVQTKIKLSLKGLKKPGIMHAYNLHTQETDIGRIPGDRNCYSPSAACVQMLRWGSKEINCPTTRRISYKCPAPNNFRQLYIKISKFSITSKFSPSSTINFWQK